MMLMSDDDDDDVDTRGASESLKPPIFVQNL